MNNYPKLLNWLKAEVKGWKIISFSLKCLCVSLVITEFFMVIIYIFSDTSLKAEKVDTYLTLYDLFFYVALIAASLIEEFLFRLIPLGIVIYLVQKYKLSDFLVILSVIIVSLLFGYVHGDFFNIPIQGSAGVALSIIYLKTGGWQQNISKAYIVCVLAHTSYNIFITFMVELSTHVY